MEDYKIKIGRRIETALALSGKKQKDLAEYLGILPNTISYFCKGTRTPNTEQIIKIALFLDVSADYLLGLSEAMTIDADIQTACKITGLSEKAITILSFSLESEKMTFGLNHLFESVHFMEFAHQLEQIYRLYQISQKGTDLLFENDSFNPCKYKSMEDFDKKIEEAIGLLETMGLLTIDKNNCFNLYMRNAEDSLSKAFEDWKEQIFNI